MLKLNKIDLTKLSQEELVKLAESLEVLEERRHYNKQEFLFPDRHNYPKHMLFMEAGAIYRERALIAGNRTGKTYLSTAEGSYHANGKYPEWWLGKRFKHPIKMWVTGKTHETTRDILQDYLLGGRHDMGSGMIPKEDLGRTTTKPGVPDAIQDAYVKHYTNGIYDGDSHISFKSYVQGVDAFMGTSIHVVLLDEEPDNKNIYSECVTRTMTTQGIVICTFTPLNGLSDVVLSFIPGGKFPEGGIGITNNE